MGHILIDFSHDKYSSSCRHNKKTEQGKKNQLKRHSKQFSLVFFAVNAVMPCQSQYALHFLEVKKVSKGINPSVEYFVSKVKKNYLGFFIFQKYGK